MENSAFYRTNPDDSSLHWAPPEVLVAIVYDVIQIAANVLGVLGPVVGAGAWLRQKSKQKQAEKAKVANKELANKALTLIEVDKFASEDLILLESFSEVLKYHGWPQIDAESDASEIYELIRRHLKENQ